MSYIELKETLHDLIKVNNDRVEAYTKAMSELDSSDNDLLKLFSRMIQESLLNKDELEEKSRLLGIEDGTTSTTMKGKIYRTWMDIKTIIPGVSRKSILSSCMHNEAAVQKAYDKAIENTIGVDKDTLHIIQSQKESLKESLKMIEEIQQ